MINPVNFSPNGDWNYPCKDEHDWHVICFLNYLNPSPSLAICKKCASLKSGWSDLAPKPVQLDLSTGGFGDKVYDMGREL